MTDIVERLRKATLYEGHGELSAMPEEAADEIERLLMLLSLYRDAVRIDFLMTGLKFAGANSSALKRAWEADMAVFNGRENTND
jgi:hypothetical protein